MESIKNPSPVLDCPYIGLKRDPNTSLGYATTANHCFRCKSPVIPRLEHQENYCLSPQFKSCEVYQAPADRPFPRGLKQRVRFAPEGRSVFQNVLFLLVLVIFAVATWFGGQFLLVRRENANNSIKATMTAYQALLPPTTEPSPTVTPTESIPTETAVPTPTRQPAQLHSLETPIKVGVNEFLIHMVIPGDQLVLLARDYQTTVEAIQSINFGLQDTIWTGTPIVISPGMLGPDPDLPSFKIYQVTDVGIEIDSLAEKLGVDVPLFKHYNNCDNGCRLDQGDWLLIPVKK